ncbi:MAG: acetyl-CoA hydrolase/transferase family protein [Polyangiaceae bacterium]|nr:acetyl-CoA hydrolase/transferase family protein [Polyangiaceae bacterium]
MTQDYKSQAQSPEDVARRIQSGARVFVHGASATPTVLLKALGARQDVEGVRLYHLHLMGDVPFFERGSEGRFRSVSFFAGSNARAAIDEGRADFVPIFLSDIPELLRSRGLGLDAAIVQVSPPDRHGNTTLGTSCDAARAAVDSADIVLAEINERMPRTNGATVVPLSKIDAFTWTDRPLVAHDAAECGPVEDRIGEIVAERVVDRATLQMGIGAIPDAVLSKLGNKLDLGIHTEMFSDGLLPLLEGGVVTNRFKSVHPGRTITSFVMGSPRLFDFVDENQLVEFHPCDRTNDTSLIRKNENVTAINSALEIDLSGQVCADSLGHRIYSGIGGQMDFIRAAALSKGGMPIITLPSTAARGTVSRIVPLLKAGAGVVTTRGHVHWVATEYGIRNLHGLTLRERAEALIDLAHPDHRAELRRAASELRHFSFC